MYLTPFAQILARLKDVRSSLGLMIAKGADKPQQSFLYNNKNNSSKFYNWQVQHAAEQIPWFENNEDKD